MKIIDRILLITLITLIFISALSDCGTARAIKSCDYSYTKVDQDRLDAQIYYICQTIQNRSCQVVKNRMSEIISNNCY